MKFDLVRSWKDEAYRQSLDAGQLDALPVNPAGELSETDLASVVGGDSPDSATDAAAAAAASTSTTNTSSRHTHSFALLCDITIFSTSIHVLAIDHLLGIASVEKQICFNRA